MAERPKATVRLLGLRFRIPPRAWMSISCECCVLDGKVSCDGPITRPEESYRLCCVTNCDLETSRMRRPWPELGCCARQTDRQNYISKGLLYVIRCVTAGGMKEEATYKCFTFTALSNCLTRFISWLRAEDAGLFFRFPWGSRSCLCAKEPGKAVRPNEPLI